MIRPSPWPDLDRLARFVRAADSLTDTLAAWTGRGLAVEIIDRVDGACPDPLVADALSLHDGARVQERSVLMRSGDAVVATARSSVAADSTALTPAIRHELRGGGSLGDLLRPVYRRRVAVRVTVLREQPASDPTVPVLAVQARLDVGGTPVAWCEETIYFLVFCSVMTVLVRTGSRSGVTASASATASSAATSSTR
jgi:chorismate-pyruvate lyase